MAGIIWVGRLTVKKAENYRSVVGFLERRLRSDLLKTCMIALRDYKEP